MAEATLKAILEMRIPKGDVLGVAKVAAIQASKETPRILPLCHPIPLEHVSVEIAPSGASALQIDVSTQATWKTGVEMEALTAAAVAALTIYDMCKALDRGMVIESVELLEKSGGRSGTWQSPHV